MKLVRLKNKHWLAWDKNKEYYISGKLDDVSEFMALHGINDKEIDDAVIELGIKNHNIAEFGVAGSFIFSYYITQDGLKEIERLL